ncbi:hypothetical protein CMI47_09640 [Candidatus Pacearchaeota archaeon]|jgi:hypothetical protein|nr:hypothetical protein [Candidatus Pacearchaeota archaeon]|tara:strand:+ start:1008 stop:1202 length:195 start_codon:yes stop_codon:yes gene_type:complete
MENTFLDALARFSAHKDKKSIMFLEYVLKKYFNDRRCFMQMKDAIPYLEKNDREQLTIIMEEII